MPIRSLAAFAAVVLLAPSASAQPDPLPEMGAYALFGSGAPERLLFPADADPDLVVGARLGRGVDVQLGYGNATHDRTWLSRLEVATYQTRESTRAVAGAVAATRRAGPVALRASASLGADWYSNSFARARPDSVDLFRGRDEPREPGVALVGDSLSTRTGRFGHGALSLSAGLPIGSGRVRFTPAVGVAGSYSMEIRSDLPAAQPRVAAFLRLPARVHVRGAAIPRS